MTSTELMEIRTALRNRTRLSDAQVVKLAQLRRRENAGVAWARVSKLSLRPGEELMDFVHAVLSAVQTDRVILADGSLDAMLHGIFDDHVVVQDLNTGRFFKADFTRTDKGEITFSDPIEVMATFVPVESADPSDDAEKAVQKRHSALEHVEFGKAIASTRWTFLPPSLRSVSGGR